MNKLFRGEFNWAGETYELYTHASSPEKAFLNFATQLSKRIGFRKRSIVQYFDGSKDNYYIKVVREGL